MSILVLTPRSHLNANAVVDEPIVSPAGSSLVAMSSSKEGKRTRGEIACAECRRLKARCDRQVPCSTCVKRGCKMLCPNGTMPPGKGSRFVGVAEDYLRRKAAKLEERMRSLEDALAIVQINTSTEQHPLLTKKWTIEDANDENDGDNTSTTAEYGVIDALGSLHLDGDLQSGVTRFFGPSGGAESLLLIAKQVGAETAPPSTEIQEIDLPAQIDVFDKTFPFTPSHIPKTQVLEMIQLYLPTISRATSLCDIFLTSLSWMFQIVSRQQIVDGIIPMVYKPRTFLPVPPAYGPHDLALLLIVLALGALLDPNLPPYNTEAQRYYRLARAALCLQNVLVQRSVATVKTLHLMSVYNGMSGVESNLENCYSFLNFAGQVALQIGFHKDPARWGFKGREAYERRSYFWTLLSLSLWQSLVTGRPPVILPAFVDCQIPSDDDEAMYQSGETPVGFGNWSARYTVECLAPIVEAIQAVKPPSYQTILELDRKIREFSVPVSDSDGMRSFAQSNYRELTLMILHRGFFAQAMADFPSDPLRSPLGQSFMVAYRCASVVITATDERFTIQPLLCSRVWRIWSFAFSAAVIIGTVATRRLGIKLYPDPFEHLEKACSLFNEAARTCTRAKKALPILLRLHQKAVHARIDPLQQASYLPSSKNSEPQDEPDELEVFGGRTMLVRTSSKQVSRFSQGNISIQLPGSTSTASNPQYQRTHHHSHFNYIPEIREEDDYNLADGALGLPPEFEGLYREIAGPQYSRVSSLYGPPQGQQSSLVLEDKWTSFMHHSLSSEHLTHVGLQAAR